MSLRRNENIEEYFQKHSNMVFRIAIQMLSNIPMAEDITQDVFLQCIKTGKTFSDPVYEKAWFIRVALNKCKDLLKSGYYRNNINFTEEMTNTLSVCFNEDELFIAQELNKLEIQERTVLYLFYFEQMTVKEIAQSLDMNVNTIKSQLLRARKKMKDNME